MLLLLELMVVEFDCLGVFWGPERFAGIITKLHTSAPRETFCVIERELIRTAALAAADLTTQEYHRKTRERGEGSSHAG